MIKCGEANRVLHSIYGSRELNGCIPSGIVEERIYPESSGSLTKLVGCSYLYKGYPDIRIMANLNLSKDASWILVNLVENKMFLFGMGLMYIFRRKRFNRHFTRLCESYFKVAYDILKKQDFIPQDYEWCVSVKELYRVSQIMIDKFKDGNMRNILSKFRDIALMIPENDTAYRFVLQDALSEIDILNLKNPIKEIRRIFDIVVDREFCGDQKNKWRRVEKKIVWTLRIPIIRKYLIEFLSQLDYEKIKLDESDWYFVLGHHCYNYRGVSAEEREREKARIDIEKKHTIPKIQLVDIPNSPNKQLIIVK